MVAVASDVVGSGGVCAHLFVARGVLNHSDCWQHDLINATIHFAVVFSSKCFFDLCCSQLSTFTIMNARSWLSRPEDFLVLQNIPN
ncbi:hypothetical protein T08_2096 [Trichinella sp. T8]|nr:hypothetical protein T08_2096 [Trichinella sp. T8]